jgi:stringent starvation protein B
VPEYPAVAPMISTKPYLIRAVRDWAIDNGYTPQVLVDATGEGVAVPLEFVEDGKIVLNVHDQAVQRAEWGNEWLRFYARFRGRETAVAIPVDAVLAVYARENGQGIVFQEDGPAAPPPQSAKSADKGAGVKTPHLRVVK